MNLVIDIGNTQTKVGWFNGPELHRTEVFSSFTPEGLEQLLTGKTVTASIISSTGVDSTPFATILEQHGRCINFTHQTPVPVNNNYLTPETLGLDRLAAVVGAHFLYPKKPVLVIDTGTAITYDLIEADGTYPGGVISPGLQMRFKAMHHFTKRLPLLQPNAETPVTGDSTESCMQSGGLNGAIFEVEGFISWYRAKYQGLITVVTGGDATIFEKHLKSKIFAVPELVLRGLNEILHYNVS